MKRPPVVSDDPEKMCSTHSIGALSRRCSCALILWCRILPNAAVHCTLVSLTTQSTQPQLVVSCNSARWKRALFPETFGPVILTPARRVWPSLPPHAAVSFYFLFQQEELNITMYKILDFNIAPPPFFVFLFPRFPLFRGTSLKQFW